MFYDKQSRINRLETKIAGLKAKLAATEELVKIASTLPGAIVNELQDIPQKIAELEYKLKILKNS